MQKQNYKLTLAYDGTKFFGWQKQKQGRTVQGEVEKALAEFVSHPVNVMCAGRTDSGVHAIAQVANVVLASNISPQKLKSALNAKLDRDIYILHSEIVAMDFHSRFRACARSYQYRIHQEPSPFLRFYSAYYCEKLDFSKLIECSDMLIGEHDFSSLSKDNPEVPNHICNIEYANWEKTENSLTFFIKADRFLHHMVRFVVGTSLLVATGKYSLEHFLELLENRANPPIHSHKSKPQGLFLEAVYFPNEIL